MSPRRNRLLLFVLCVTFLCGCHKDDEVAGPHTILTLQVDAAYGVATDNWIFATDDDGVVLDAKSYTAGETVTLVSDKPGDKINVTFFNRTGTKLSAFSTYSDVPSGTVLHFEALVPPTRASLQGTATFMISNISSLSSTVQFSNGDSYSSQSTVASNETDIDATFYGVPSDFLLRGYHEGRPVYNWAKGVKDGDVIKRDFEADFVPFPHQRKLDFEGETECILYARNTQSNYVMLDTYDLVGTAYYDQPTIGYIDGFDSYNLIVTNTQSNGTVTYRSDGEPNLSFTMPTFTFSLNSNGTQDLSFSFSEDYTYYTSGWSYTQDSEYISWFLYAPPGAPAKGLTIPDEIKAKYPQIDMSKFKHSSLYFTKMIEGDSYLESMRGTPATGDAKNQRLYLFAPKL